MMRLVSCGVLSFMGILLTLPMSASVKDNQASGDDSTVAGGRSNQATAGSSVVSGGRSNEAVGGASVVAGGWNNKASGIDSTVGGGCINVATGEASVVVVGGFNKANGRGSAINGGRHNLANGLCSTVTGGERNKAHGDHSFASGFKANASDKHSAVLGFSGEECQSMGEKTVHVCSVNGFFVNGHNLTQQIGALETKLGLVNNNKTADSFTAERWNLRVDSLEEQLEEVQAEKREATNKMMSLAQDLALVQREFAEENMKLEKHMESQAQLIRVLQGQLETQQVALQGVMLCSSESDCSAADGGSSGGSGYYWWRTLAWILLLFVLHMAGFTLLLIGGCMVPF